ncbi:hypothetical protein [Wenzhouxiangella sp. EGI_FJ10305]|uniref:hypothetical protein n=1 Tax=Wenzhouxiangella sp. EGI_FJ10305 TaxID=3243768 RepID=UPI0035D73BEB
MFGISRSEPRQQARARHCCIPSSSFTRVLALMAAVWLTSFIIGCGLAGNPDERVLFGKEPQPLEYEYLHLATELWSEKPCYLISDESITVGVIASSGRQASYLRSTCFRYVAAILERPDLCEHVVSVSTLFDSGHDLNQESCEQLARRGDRGYAGGSVEHQAMFELAGFTETDIKDLLRKHDIPPSGTYCLLYSREFFAAIENLPNFAGEDDLEKMKAVEWRPHQLLTLQGFPCTGKFLHEYM